ncbi:MAG: winged helix-turn-helix transcriptional regulator [Nitrosotalea sp.]
MSEQALIDLLRAISEDIHWIRMDIARLARDSYKQDLEKIANTPARQEIWRLCDGNLSNEEIAKRIGVTLRAVQYFVQDAERLGLVSMPKRGYPKRPDTFNEIPSEWKPYKKPEGQPTEAELGGGSQ